MQPADFGPPDAFVNGTPCSSYYGQQTARTLPKFQGKTLPFAVCGYTPDAAARRLRRRRVRRWSRPRRDGRDHRRLRRADAARATRTRTRSGTATSRSRTASSRTAASPRTPRPASDCGGNGWYGEQALDVEAVHGMAPARTSSTTARRAASTTTCSPRWPGRGTTTRPRSSPTRGASRRSSWSTASSSRRSTRASSTPTSRSSSRAPSRGSASTSPPATTATTSTRSGVQASRLPDRRPVGHLGRRHVARDRQATTSARSRPAGAPTKYDLSTNGKSLGEARRPFLVRRGRRLQPGLQRARGTRTASCRATHERPRGSGHRAWTPTRRPACSSARRRTSRCRAASGRPASTTASTASAARASPRRCSPASQAVAQGGARHRLRQPADLLPGDAAGVVLRRDAAGRHGQRRAPTTPTASTPTTASSTRSGRSTRTRRSSPARAGTT